LQNRSLAPNRKFGKKKIHCHKTKKSNPPQQKKIQPLGGRLYKAHYPRLAKYPTTTSPTAPLQTPDALTPPTASSHEPGIPEELKLCVLPPSAFLVNALNFRWPLGHWLATPDCYGRAASLE
jgi:hypothetical protein